ncbi:AraC family transcriptional regulator [Paenibacillus sp. WLX2291]|uniref:helix-turn-helix domain-containing protein n=1 Tax=Paenibacillus sp. WLX2291 TaxID=3296934 RepID=UPI00398444FE
MTKDIPIIHDRTLVDVKKINLSRIERPFFRTEEKDVLSPHRHDFYEIFWLVKGSGTVTIDFKTYALNENVICFISPGQVHGWSFEDTDQLLQGYLIKFHKDIVCKQESDSFSFINNYIGNIDAVCYINQEQTVAFDRIFELLHRESEMTMLYSDEAIRFYLQLILIEIQRNQMANTIQQTEDRAYLLTKSFLKLVEEHFKSHTSVDNYARMLFVTPNHLIQTTKRTLGKTAGELIRDRQMLEAKRLLQFSRLSIEHTAQHIGFTDPSYFGRVFKQYTGYSPSKFRSQS